MDPSFRILPFYPDRMELASLTPELRLYARPLLLYAVYKLLEIRLQVGCEFEEQLLVSHVVYTDQGVSAARASLVLAR